MLHVGILLVLHVMLMQCCSPGDGECVAVEVVMMLWSWCCIDSEIDGLMRWSVCCRCDVDGYFDGMHGHGAIVGPGVGGTRVHAVDGHAGVLQRYVRM